MSALYIAAGAAIGAPVRWWVDQLVQRRWSPVFPWGTFTVNVVGSFILGVLLAAAPQHHTLASVSRRWVLRRTHHFQFVRVGVVQVG